MTRQDSHQDGADPLDFPGARRLRAAGKVAPPSAEAVAAALAAVRSAASSAEGGGPVIALDREPAATVVPMRRWRRRVPVLVSAAAVAAIALGVAFQPWSGPEETGSSPAAERTGAAPYWKVRTFQWNRTVDPGQRPDETHQTTWVSRNGTREQSGDGPVLDYSVADVGGTVYVIGGRPISWDDLPKLPTDPAALRARLLGKATGDSAIEDLYDGIEELLARSPAEPKLRAALFTVLTELPGARVTKGVEDSTGRSGTAVAIDADTWRRQLIVDTRAFHALESVNTAREDGLKWGSRKLRAGDPLHRTTYLSVGPAWKAPKPVREAPKPA
ncbi:hypothetical protein [Streptomyces sp. NPDC057702]|uniref:hypothetical protein n=1 Tax=unclassified Streptomyces TaxID=2593676 RepID=UPI0036A4FB5D